MPSSGTRRSAATLLLCVMLVAVPRTSLAQDSQPPAPRTSAALKRTAWIAIGAGIGFGAGLLWGVWKFDDAINGEGKMWASALTGAAAGGLAGAALSWRIRPSQPGPRKDDSLWEGMAMGAAVGAAVGVFIIPSRNCKPENPECPLILGVGVGIPAIAVGAAIGAIVDKIRK